MENKTLEYDKGITGIIKSQDKENFDFNKLFSSLQEFASNYKIVTKDNVSFFVDANSH